ncbi:predicted protein [Postia placenta Mad-698-R]|nr:predicted protein [Postia placenta Mad-698-R]
MPGHPQSASIAHVRETERELTSSCISKARPSPAAAAAERVAQSARDDIYPGNASEITVCTAAISAMDDHTPPGDTHGGHVEHAYAVSPPHFAFDDAFSDADDAEERLEFSPEAIREDIAKTFTTLDKHVAQDEAENFARKIGRAVARVRHGQLHERGRCGARVRIATASYKLVDGVLFAARNMMTVQRSRDGDRAHCKGIRNIAGVIERTQGTQKHRNTTPRQGERDGKPGMVANVSGPHNLNQLHCNSHVTTYQWDTVHYGLVECIRMVSSRSLVPHNTMRHVLSSRFGMYWSPTTPATSQIAHAPLEACKFWQSG